MWAVDRAQLQRAYERALDDDDDDGVAGGSRDEPDSVRPRSQAGAHAQLQRPAPIIPRLCEGSQSVTLSPVGL